MAGTGKFTFVFTEKDLSLLAEAAEVASMAVESQASNISTVFTRSEFRDMAHRLDERLHW